MSIIKDKIHRIISECDKHLLRINSSYIKMSHNMPLDKNKYINLSEDEVEHIDQYLFRFAKLQDAIGAKFFKSLLLFLNEDIENKPFIDILNKLEKLNVLSSAQEWIELRNIRNDVAHNYDDDAEEMSIAINLIYSKKDNLVSIYEGIKKYYENHCDIT